MLQIVIPMGGEGKPFIERGYTFPKPLVEIHGRSMIEIVVENLTPKIPHHFTFLSRKDHLTRFALADVLQLLTPGCRIIPIGEPTKGALCTVLLACEHLAPEEPLLIANSDQHVGSTLDDFLAAAANPASDAAIMTFPSTHPKYSYVRIEDDRVVEVVEKRPVSRRATAGLYYFSKASDFIAAAERTILKNAALAAEFYVSMAYNELILRGKIIIDHLIPASSMNSLGTPEEVELFKTRNAPKIPSL